MKLSAQDNPKPPRVVATSERGLHASGQTARICVAQPVPFVQWSIGGETTVQWRTSRIANRKADPRPPQLYGMAVSTKPFAMPSSAPRPSHCQNCCAEMFGDHCFQCGQPVKGLVRHFSSIIGDFLDSVFDLDALVPRTLGPLLLRPGYLSQQYFEGHRVRYVSPVRLFVFLCIASFFVLKLAIDPFVDSQPNPIEQAMTVAEVEAARDLQINALEQALSGMPESSARQSIERELQRIRRESTQRISWLEQREQALAKGLTPPPEPGADGELRFGTEQPWHSTDNPLRFDPMPDWFNDQLNVWIGRGQKNIQRIQEEPALLKDAFIESLPQIFFVLLPLFALLLKAVYLFKRRLFMEHLIVALHGHAFMCVAVLLLVMLERLAGWLDDQIGAAAVVARIGEAAVWLWIPLYLWLTQKRVYGQGWLMTTLKFGLVGTLYLILLGIGALLSLLVSVVTL